MSDSTIKQARAAVMERVRAHLQTAGVTKKGLAELASLHPNTLQGVEDDGWNPTDATLIALEAHLPSAQQVAA